MLNQRSELRDLCTMFMWFCAVIALTYARHLEDTKTSEIAQLLGDFISKPTENVDKNQPTGHWYQIGIYQSKEQASACRHLVIGPKVTKILDDACEEMGDQSSSQHQNYELLKINSENILLSYNVNEENKIDSLSIYGRITNPKQIQNTLPAELGHMVLTPCETIYKECTRSVRNTVINCDDIKQGAYDRQDSNNRDYTFTTDYLDDNVTICTKNDTDYAVYDDVFIPLGPKSHDTNEESNQEAQEIGNTFTMLEFSTKNPYETSTVMTSNTPELSNSSNAGLDTTTTETLLTTTKICNCSNDGLDTTTTETLLTTKICNSSNDGLETTTTGPLLTITKISNSTKMCNSSTMSTILSTPSVFMICLLMNLLSRLCN